MFADAVDGLAEAGAAELRHLETNPLGFWIATMLAGAYVGLGILPIFSVGSALDPAVRPLAMGATFGLAPILVVFAGAELFTGHTMVGPLAVGRGLATGRQLATLWATSWLGNLAGALLLAALFGAGGGGIVTTAASGLLYEVAAAEMNLGAVELVARAILCNRLVCLALWMSARIASEAARMIAIAWCLLAFIASGYEHSVANMTVFGVALLSAHPPEVSWAGMAWNLFWVTLGNTIAGALFVAGAYAPVARPPALAALTAGAAASGRSEATS